MFTPIIKDLVVENSFDLDIFKDLDATTVDENTLRTLSNAVNQQNTTAVGDGDFAVPDDTPVEGQDTVPAAGEQSAGAQLLAQLHIIPSEGDTPAQAFVIGDKQGCQEKHTGANISITTDLSMEQNNDIKKAFVNELTQSVLPIDYSGASKHGRLHPHAVYGIADILFRLFDTTGVQSLV